MKIMNRGTRATRDKKAYALWGCLFALCVSSAQGLDYFAENGDTAVTLKQHPSIASSGNKTYVAYQGPSEDAYVCSYDHVTGVWDGPVLAGTSLMRDGDGHGKPTIAVDDAGYVHIVFGGHGGHDGLPGDYRLYAYGNPPATEKCGKQTHMRSDSPNDISSWTEMPDTSGHISGHGTYSQLIKMDDGDMYLFYRHGRHRSDWTYQRSTDNGLTWEKEVIIMDCIPAGDRYESWYMWFGKTPNDTITCAYAFHDHGEPEGNHENLYYMKMNCSDHSWANAAGSPLSMPLVKAAADAQTLAYNSSGVEVRDELVRLDPNGKPWMLFSWDNDQIACVRWTGSAWTAPIGIDGSMGNASADLIILSATSAKLIMSGEKQNRKKSVSWYETNDSGANWQWTFDLFTETSGRRIGSLYLDGHSDAQLLLGGAGGLMYLYGESGFVLCPRN